MRNRPSQSGPPTFGPDNQPNQHHPGFTIVELLVVIGVISVLIGLLLPALSGVQKRSAKSSEINSLKQVHYAWMMYANNNNDAALPGFLEVDVQAPPVSNVSRGWGVKYDYPTPPQGSTDKTIPPAPSYSSAGDNIAGPWTWRLLAYLDHSHQMVHGYADETDESMFELVNEAQEIAYEPGFGYNGYYVGGYWRMQSVESVQTPRYDFHSDCATLPNDSSPLTIPTGVGQIQRSSELITFCSSSKFEAGETGPHYKIPSDRPGAHLITPPTVRNEARWRPDPSDPTAVVVEGASGDTFAPIGRYTGFPAVLAADGHAESQGVNALFDQRKWINNASNRLYTHNACP